MLVMVQVTQINLIINNNLRHSLGSVFCCLTKTTSCASGSEKLLAMYQKSPPKVLY